MPFEPFDRSRLRIRPLAERDNDLQIGNWMDLEEEAPPYDSAELPALAERIVAARRKGAAVLTLMGAHVLRAGVSRHLIDLMERGFLTHLAMNGAGPIHDYELAAIGETTESVARYIRTGEFGLWRETARINDIVKEGNEADLGMGEAVGKAIEDGDFPHKNLSVLAAGYRLRVPVTVHIGLGYDIIHEHPNCDGAALGAASYRDFLILAKTVENLEGGAVLNYGTAVMGPEVYLKALSMARNVARQEGREIRRFTTAAFDLIPIEGDFREQAPKSNPQYYYRPWKTVLVRTVADGGEAFYFCGDHRATVPALRKRILEASR